MARGLLRVASEKTDLRMASEQKSNAHGPLANSHGLAVLVTALLFGLSYTQAPLYYSNQNQYFLHGVAHGGMGFLADDWLAGTADPTPLFSFVVALTYRYFDEALFYVYYLAILGVYCASLLRLFDLLHPGRSLPVRLAFALALVLLHSGLLRLLSGRLLGTDYPWYFQAGLAGQYLLGPVLQPSTVGVLLLVSVVFFVGDRPFAAAAVAALAAVGHATYLLPAGLLVCSYLVVLLRGRRWKTAGGAGALAAGLVTPMLVYNIANFAPTSAAAFAEAQTILVHFRIPHHCLVERWFDGIAGAQIAWVALGMALARRSRLLPVMLICSLAALVLSVIQVATGNEGLALLFPWRPSVFLVPLATAVIVCRLVAGVAGPLDRLGERGQLAAAGGFLAGMVGLAVGGVLINGYGLAYQMSADEAGIVEYIRANKIRGEVYLLPVELPKPPAKPGASMSDFKSLVQRTRGRGLIPIELQGFRLRTGAPIFVDFKSIPYRDVDVLEWHRRLQANLRVYDGGGPDVLRAMVTEHPLTHVVVPAEHSVPLPGATVVYEDPYYRLYRLAR